MKNFNYSVKVKNGAGWRCYDTARLQISVGGDRHEGKKFSATIDWIAKNFDHAIICVNDTLQRFNLMANGMPESVAQRLSEARGQDWINRHKIELSKLPSYQIHIWDEWKTEAFQEKYIEVISRFENDPEFYRAVLKSQKNKLSIPYILEEIAVFSLMYEADKAVDVYPGTLPEAMYIFSEQHHTRIDFKRKAA